MKSPLTFTDCEFVKKTVITAGIRLLNLPNTKILASKNLGHVTTSIVTQADIDTEDFLRGTLQKRFPSFGFYSEETAKGTESELLKEYVWVVDPIDGTLNFSRGLPFYSVSVALMHKEKPLLGMLYFPVDDAMYWAVKDGGAFLGKSPIRVSSRLEGDGIYPVLSCLGLTNEQYGAFCTILSQNKILARGIGCCTYHLAHVATGQFDLHIGINQALWDFASGWIIVEEAGCVFDRFFIDNKRRSDGKPYHHWFVAGNNRLVSWFVPKLEEFINQEHV